MASTLDTYTHGHHESVVSQHRKRTASEAAAFLLPHLRPGMRLLDVGCGPGSITLGLAEAVAPGEVLAIDPSADVLDEARGLAVERGVSNVRFEHGDTFTTSRTPTQRSTLSTRTRSCSTCHGPWMRSAP